MIILEELDVKEKERGETLPPYSPRRSVRLPFISTPRNAGSVQSTAGNTLHPHSASLASPNYAASQSSLTVNSNVSSQTLLAPPLPTPPPSAPFSTLSNPQCSLSISSSLSSLLVPRLYPPSHLQASNNVCVQRESAAITGSFLIDPALQIPDCLLPDDPDVLLIRDNEPVNGKGKQKRANLCLVTRGGDISVDIWVREGCALQGRDPVRRQGGGSSVSGSSVGGSSFSGGSRSTRNSLDSYYKTDYWRADWTSPPPSMPWPEKTKERVDIDIRSETGSIAVRIHAQSHQRLRISVSSAQGSIAVGIPRTFAGYVQSNAQSNRSDSVSSSFSMDSMSSSQYLRSTSSIYTPSILSEKEKEKDRSSLKDDLVNSIVQEIAQALPITPRQPVQFSLEMENVVTTLSGHRKTTRGRYLVGDAPNQLISEHMGVRYFDELHFESYTGTMGVFYNDEFLQLKSDGIVTKLLNKARQRASSESHQTP